MADGPVTLAPTGETVEAWNAFGRDDLSVQLGAATVSPAEVLEAYDHFATELSLPSSENRAAPSLRA